MSLKIYNTLTHKKEEFTPIAPPKVGMYVCGVTVYDYSHIGHARSSIAFDVIYRYLKYKGYDVAYVRNFTDIDDKIIKRSGEMGIATGELTERFIRAYHEDMSTLGLLSPDIEPHCTDYVEKMTVFIEKLVAKGTAYPTESGDVYFRVGSFPEYGKLSRKNLDDLEAGARVEVSDRKENPLDFVLWKAAKPGEPKWDSPWGEGRPGWHIECSVMSTHNIGETLDIHGGGKDLIFPHHENEIAQSEALTGRPYARYWIHNGFVNVPSDDNPDGTKMSKSLGNFYTIRDVLAAYHPQAVKFFMLGTHYRNDVLFTEDGLNKAQERLTYFYETLHKTEAFLEENGAERNAGGAVDGVKKLVSEFRDAMDDDFNTPRVFGQLAGAFKRMNELLVNEDLPAGERAAELYEWKDGLAEISGVLGIFDLSPARFEADLKSLRVAQIGMTVEAIEGLIEERKQARADKNWARADEIRDELMAKGVLLKDHQGVTDWTVKS